jgi:carbon starvation protein
MITLLIALGSIVGYLIAYHTYGRWLARKIFALDPRAAVPSVQLNDDRDYVPTRKTIVFGHHFTSIAGTGPIVGPALAIMWGWVPALLWVVFGAIFIGAVHDFGALVVSLRNRGQTIGDIAGRVLTPRVRLLFLSILLFGLWVVLAVFGLVIAGVFRSFPESILPVFLQIPIAVWIGLYVHRRGKSVFWVSVVALALMYLTVWMGAGCPGVEGTGGWLGETIRAINAKLAALPMWVWTAILLAYCYVASVIPVWVLLQPRDYINSLQLISSLALIVLGLGVAATVGSGGESLAMVAPAVRWDPVGAPPIAPFLFITIACGAISGFHCLVSSGTTSKQLRCETDAQFVGYGSMLTESFLAVLVILAVAAGIGLGWPAKFPDASGAALWNQVYASWHDASAPGIAVGAFVVGSANFLQALGLDHTLATALMGVLVASFAGTTLDTATRLQRYVVQELASTFGGRQPQHVPREAPVAAALPQAVNPLRWLTTKHGATLFAVSTAFALSLFPRPGQPWAMENLGQGGLMLWPLFGATNQLLGGLAFLVVTFWLWRRSKPVWFVALPAAFMLVMPAAAMMLQIGDWYAQQQYVLVFVAAATLALEAWMIVEAALLWRKARGVLEAPLPPLGEAAPAAQRG